MTISVRTTCVRQTFHKFLCPCFFNPIQPPKGGGGDDLFIERLTENPFLIDSTLFNILIDLFASGSRKSAVSKIRREIFGEISDQCVSVIRGMKGFVRHYTGVINIAFHSTLSPEEFADGLYENYREAYADELNGIHYRHDKETALARRFCTHYWLCAARQAAHSKRLCKLVFGLPDEIVDMLADASSDTIEMFAAYAPQRFALIYSDVFFKSIGTVKDDQNMVFAADNRVVMLLKAGFAIQSSACFKRNPIFFSAATSYEVWDIFRCTPERTPVEATPMQTWCARRNEFNREVTLAYQHINRNRFRGEEERLTEMELKSRRKILCADLRPKQALVPLLYVRGLTNNQIASLFGMTEAQVRGVTGSLKMKNDGRRHKRCTESSDEHMIEKSDRKKATQESLTMQLQNNFFISLYCTLCEDYGLKTVDLQAFFTAEAILKKLAINTRLQFDPSHMETAELWDTILKLIQGLYQAQKCPVCGFVSFTRKDNGEYNNERDSDIYPCPIKLAFAEDKSLAAFSAYIRDHPTYIPSDDDAFIERWGERHPSAERAADWNNDVVP